MKSYKHMRSALVGLSALAFLGLIQFASQAGKPSLPPGAPTIVLSGAIEGIGRSTAIRVAFDKSIVRPPISVIANPDYSAAVFITGVNKDPRTLRFYYCDSPDHDGTADLVCKDPGHSPHYYKCLRIQGGIPQPKSNQVIFPAGSPWDISWKETMSGIASGTLETYVSYDAMK